jgi:hypothetical protein
MSPTTSFVAMVLLVPISVFSLVYCFSASIEPAKTYPTTALIEEALRNRRRRAIQPMVEDENKDGDHLPPPPPMHKGNKTNVTGEVANGLARSDLTPFQHDPLDRTQRSIRLLTVLPDLSNAGLIQCHIWHDTVDAAYDCLSYVWGSDQVQKQILLNGKRCTIRKNLWDFLGVARTKYANPPRVFWIDALCIDQNSILERNHQVAQMGAIFANAVEVIAWFGHNPNISRAFEFWLNLEERGLITAGQVWRLWDGERNERRACWSQVLAHSYWRRAWITQEIYSARRFIILAGNLEVEPARLSTLRMMLPGVNKRGSADHPTGWGWGPRKGKWSGPRVVNTYLEVLYKKPYAGKSRLIDLLHELPRRVSEIPRDRIYSLLSIASDASAVPVDYAGSDHHLLLRLLNLYRSSMCLCLWTNLVNTLEIKPAPSLDTALGLSPQVFKLSLIDGETFPELRWTRNTPNLKCQNCGEDFEKKWVRTYKLSTTHICELPRLQHVFLYRCSGGGSAHYTIGRIHGTPEFEVNRVEIMELPMGDAEARFSRFNVYITATVLAGLVSPPDRNFEAHIPFGMCANALEGRGTLEILDRVDESM